MLSNGLTIWLKITESLSTAYPEALLPFGVGSAGSCGFLCDFAIFETLRQGFGGVWGC